MKTMIVILLSLVLSLLSTLCARGTPFTYQGRLHHAGGQANGLYEMSFPLYDAVTDGTLFGTPLHLAPVPVTNLHIGEGRTAPVLR